MANPSAVGASVLSRTERAAERRLALLALIVAVMGVTVALNKRKSVVVLVIFMVGGVEEGCRRACVVACVVAVLCDELCDVSYCAMCYATYCAIRLWKSVTNFSSHFSTIRDRHSLTPNDFRTSTFNLGISTYKIKFRAPSRPSLILFTGVSQIRTCMEE